jgi:hypothetical protein
MTAAQAEQAWDAVNGAEAYRWEERCEPIGAAATPELPHEAAHWRNSMAGLGKSPRCRFSLHADPLSATLPMRPCLEHNGTCSGETTKDLPPGDGKHCQLANEKGDSHHSFCDELCNSFFFYG